MPVISGSPPIEITLRRTAVARRFSLRVSRLDGKITLSMPLRARDRDAMDFARTQEGWLRRTLAAMPVADQVGIGSMVPVEGRMLQLQPGLGRSPAVSGESLLMPGDPARAGVRAQAWLKVLARKVICVTLRPTSPA